MKLKTYFGYFMLDFYTKKPVPYDLRTSEKLYQSKTNQQAMV